MNNDDTYHLALGKFVDAFATAEHNLKFALRKLSGVTDQVAQVIFSSTRVDIAIIQIRQLYEATGQTPIIEVDSALSQMKAISTVRNAIMHYGASVDGEHFTTSKGPHALPSKAEIRHHPIIDLEKMTVDLLVVGRRFMWICVQDMPNAFPEAIKLLDDVSSIPLRYKPPQATPDHKEHARAPKHPNSAQKPTDQQ